MEAIAQDCRFISLFTPLGKDKLVLTAIEGHEAISELFEFKLSAFSTTTNISASQLIGKQLTATIRDGKREPRYFCGIVKSLATGPLLMRQSRRYYITLVPKLWTLTQTSDFRIFQNATALQIIEKIFKEHQISDYDISHVRNKQITRTYCVQYRETAYHFVSRLMQEEGIYFYFTFKKDKHTLMLADQAAGYKQCVDPNLIYATGSKLGNQIDHWEHEYTFCAGKYSQTDYDFEKPSENILTSEKSTVSIANNNSFEIFDYPGGYANKADGDGRTKIDIQTIESQYQTVNAAGYCLNLSAGVKFNLKTGDVPAEQGNYVVTEIVHEAFDETHYAGAGRSQEYKNRFRCIPASIAFKSPTKITKPLAYGVQSALVVGKSGDEIYTDKYGRIKVQFHWDRHGKKDDKSSCWVPVAQQWAGKQWGSVFIPRVGQEVLVSFLNGDPDYPIVVTSTYNMEHMPPYSLPQNATQSGVKTHSSKNGGTNESNELRFEDKKGSEEVYVHAQKDYNRVVENNETTKVKNKQAITITNDRTIEITSGNESYTLRSGNREVKLKMGNHSLQLDTGNASIKASLGSCSTEAMQSITLKVGMNTIKIDNMGITIDGLMVKINGKTMVQAEAGAMLKLRGAITMIN